MAESRSNGTGRAPQDFGETLGAIFARYARLFGVLLLVGALLGLLLAVTESMQFKGLQLLEAEKLPVPAFFLAVIAGLLGNAYFWTVALLRADGILAGGDGGGSFSRARGLLLPVIAYMAIYVLLVMTGLVLLALPGIFLAVLLTPGVILIVLRDSGVFAALKRSAVLVWGSWWFSLGVLLTVTLVAAIPLAIAEAFLAELRGSSDPGDWMTAAALNVVGMIVVLPLFAARAVGGLSTEDFATSIGLRPESIRVHLCRRGSYYGIRPAKLPNGRLLWPGDAVERLLGGDAPRS